MRRRDLLLSAGALTLRGATRPPASVFRYEHVLGTSLEMRFDAPDPERAANAALDEIERLRTILSSYDPNSEFSRWAATRHQAVHVSPELLEVLSLYDHWGAASQGTLSAAFAAAPGGPDRHWRLDPASGTATRLTDTPLVLNSFTKSYVLDRAADAALRDADGALLNLGGDLVVRGRLAETVGIANPLDDTENTAALETLAVRNVAVATSGTSRRGLHLVDPRTGERPSHIASATVISPNAVEAGALATAFAVLPAHESRALAAQRPGVEYLLLAANGTRHASAGWNSTRLAPVAQAPAGFEAVIQLELARIDAQRYRRPYVAVWVEDKDRFPIRTLALWIEKDRWLPELKGWYRDDRLRLLAEGNDVVSTLTSATRPPGKYTLKWDGKDAKGVTVKPGKYTICLEVSREHGGYQILKQEVDTTGASRQFPLIGGAEIAAASIDFRKAGGH